MNYTVTLQNVSEIKDIPSLFQFRRWVSEALNSRRETGEVVIRIVNFEESQQLNNTYRHKNKPTNVLSFPAELEAEIDDPWIGDLVVCAPLVAQEAAEQGKTLEAHWAHLIIHGTLHLIGYDHETDAQAYVMEGLERELMQRLNFQDPYLCEH